MEDSASGLYCFAQQNLMLLSLGYAQALGLVSRWRKGDDDVRARMSCLHPQSPIHFSKEVIDDGRSPGLDSCPLNRFLYESRSFNLRSLAPSPPLNLSSFQPHFNRSWHSEKLYQKFWRKTIYWIEGREYV